MKSTKWSASFLLVFTLTFMWTKRRMSAGLVSWRDSYWQRKGVAGSGGGPVKLLARPSSPAHLPRGSVSPHSLTNSNPPYSPRIAIEVESPLRSRGKRSALDAFSPTSTSFDHERPAKRPISLAVEIPQSTATNAHTPSPLESLQCFSKLSLGSSPAPSQCAENCAVMASARHIPPQTLIASYRFDPTKPRPGPKVCIVLIW